MECPIGSSHRYIKLVHETSHIKDSTPHPFKTTRTQSQRTFEATQLAYLNSHLYHLETHLRIACTSCLQNSSSSSYLVIFARSSSGSSQCAKWRCLPWFGWRPRRTSWAACQIILNSDGTRRRALPPALLPPDCGTTAIDSSPTKQCVQSAHILPFPSDHPLSCLPT